MGNTLIDYYQKKIKDNWKIAFFSTFIIGLLVHIYKFSNTLLNHDSIYNFYSNQNVLGSGRWFLSISCGLTSYFDLPWVNGLISIIFISLAMAVIVEIFRMKNPIAIIISSALLVTFPGITETFFFGFTADGYMMALLFSVLAVYYSRFEEKRFSRKVISIILIGLSCGIYQAYVSFYLVLLICYFLIELLENNYLYKEYINWIIQCILIFVIALGVYYAIWKICMFVQNVSVNYYQGINEVGKMNFSLIIHGIKETIITLILFFLGWNILENPINLYAILNIVFIISFCTVLIIAWIKSKLIYRIRNSILAILSLIICFFSICIWYFTSKTVSYRPMMLVSLAILYIFMMVLCDRCIDFKLNNFFVVLLIAISFNWGIIANISYYNLEQSNKQTYAIGLEMMMKIHDLESDYDLENIAIIGTNIEDVNFEVSEPSNKIHFLSPFLKRNIMYDQEHVVNYLKNVFDLNLDCVSNEELNELKNDAYIMKMKNWPNKYSVTVKDKTVIIKLSDYSVGD